MTNIKKLMVRMENLSPPFAGAWSRVTPLLPGSYASECNNYSRKKLHVFEQNLILFYIKYLLSEFNNTETKYIFLQ